MRTEDFEEGEEITLVELSDLLAGSLITNIELGPDAEIHHGPAVRQILIHTNHGSVIIGSCEGVHREHSETLPVLYFTQDPSSREPTDDEIYNGHGKEGGIAYG